MNIEENIFNRTTLEVNKLLAYGFKQKKNHYIYSKNIMNDTFRVDVIVTNNNEVREKVIDLAFNEEYTNYRNNSQPGKFAILVKKEVEEILIDIKTKCTVPKYFMTDQANRISKMLKEKYNTTPEFLWEKFPNYGIFRNTNHKWYGIIMNINKNKLEQEDLEIEIMNIKISKEKLPQLLKKKGFYPAYHMNKTTWVSIILDDTVSDDEIMLYIIESYKLSLEK